MTSILDTLLVTPPEISEGEVEGIALSRYGLSGAVKHLGGERDRNFLFVHTDDGADRKDILFKVANSSERDELLDMQCRALKHIRQTDPSLPVPELIPTIDGRQWAIANLAVGESVRIRAFTFLPGISVGDVLEDSGLMKNLGRAVARLDISLRGFFHASASHALAWDVQNIDQVEGLVDHIHRADERALVEQTLANFRVNIKPLLGCFRSQVIHNDVSYHNTVVDPNNPGVVTGIFDFGDMIFAPTIQNLATLAAEAAAGCADPISRSAEIVAGYNEILPLEAKELEVLPGFMAARLALCLLIDSWSETEVNWTDEREFMSGWRDKYVSMITGINRLETSELENIFRSSCGLPLAGQISRTAGDAASALKQRNRYLGNANYIAYDTPLHLTRSEGVWLWDSQGNRYLDAYNNVPHAGHCHPRIVSAIARQTAALNTNTRYLYDVATDYAEKLTATLPDELEVCYFVSSGSEANDLAWRLATACTGNTGGLVLEYAYHGITQAIYALSPAEMKKKSDAFEHVVEIPAPDDYRGPWKRKDPQRGNHYAQYACDAIAELQAKGHRPAAFFMDMIMSSNGIFSPAPGYLESIYTIVRGAGGLCIADEVQSGFGRTGKNMWGFQVGDVVPDIVTFGKPIAGGYPMGLVVTTRKIADQFARVSDFFSTTGGNPVACAAALAMLEVIEDEKLMHNADRTGELIMAGIRQLATRFPLIGDVRGSGLFIGVELVKDRETQEPARDETNRVLNHLRNNGVLVGVDGLFHNVLKIRPPMVFNHTHVGMLLNKLENALQQN